MARQKGGKAAKRIFQLLEETCRQGKTAQGNFAKPTERVLLVQDGTGWYRPGGERSVIYFDDPSPFSTIIMIKSREPTTSA